MEPVKIIYFLSASIILTIAPGPDIIFVMIQSITQRKMAGIATALGLCTGLVVHTTAAALGISVFFRESVVAFNILKYAGVLYLLYLAWKAFREDAHLVPAEKSETKDLLALYKQGIFMNILNPKVALFFLAFLPQFVTPTAGNIPLQMIMLGVLFMLQAIVIFTVVSCFSQILGMKVLRNSNLVRKINVVKGCIFVLIGLTLAFPI